MGMLALERRINESIIIDGWERTAIDAPRACAVNREEIHDEIMREKRLMAAKPKSC